MSIKKLAGAAGIPSKDLEDWGEPKNIGTVKCQLRGTKLCENPDGGSGGIWECTPGKFIREVVQAEFVTFLSGKCIFHPDNGDPIAIKAGDVLFYE